MMRSMYSAVSGLKTHQTKMDVIGNNIANVNTVAFKSSSVTFQDILYQTTSNASGANAATGVGGINAKQIGLGVTTGATNLSITSAGAAETTGNPFDIRLSDQSTTHFFIVNNGSENVFTRSGSTVMGWQVDPDTGEIVKDTVSALRIMQPANQTSAPEATTQANVSGIIDKNDSDVVSDNGMTKTLTFYDNLGYQYTARFKFKSLGQDGQYSVELEKILDSEGKTFYDPATSNVALSDVFGLNAQGVTLSSYDEVSKGFYIDPATGTVYSGSDNTGTALTFSNGAFTDGTNTYTLKQVFGISDAMVEKLNAGTATAAFTNGVLTISGDTTDYGLQFSTADGSFIGIGDRAGNALTNSVTLNMTALGNNPTQFSNITIDFSQLQDAENGGKSTVVMDKGSADDASVGTGKALGSLIGLSVDNSGKIYGTYDNGNTELLGQIAVAQFANASGLEKVGDNCYRTTLNSGEFDGIGVEISADGSSMTSGELEMSNVDLSTEFTQMIITQRGFQANSRRGRKRF